MEFNSQIVTTPPRPAATIVMLRDGADGLEVFLLKRHGLSDVLGGVHVFPGGKVDLRDAELDMDLHLDRPQDELRANLGEQDLDARTAAGLYVAAIREAFEESGVLFAQGARQQDALRAHALLREGHAFDEMLGRMALRLDCAGVVPWSRWITPTVPSMMTKRFDTRFFVAAVPADQIARHDEHETTESVWIAPRAALHQYWDGTMQLAAPQIMSLAHLTHYGSVASALAAARARRPPVVAPEPFDDEAGRVICYPGDERHSVAERALPGPTRLYLRNKRFEPEGGFEALFKPALQAAGSAAPA